MSVTWKLNKTLKHPTYDMLVHGKYQHCWIAQDGDKWHAVTFTASPSNLHTYHTANSEEEAKQYLIKEFVLRRMDEARRNRTY
jgi:hypothetical protein